MQNKKQDAYEMLKACPSPAMQRVVSLIARLSASHFSPRTILLTGETGVGKGVVAKAIHEAMKPTEPWVVFDCSAQNRDLILSALCGHEKGAFTHATDSRTGAIQMAGGGTIFLDEVGELSLLEQHLFLRVTDGNSFTKVGGSSVIVPQCTFISATNKDLGKIVGNGFREDLYYRLAGLTIEVPALRDRVEDIMPLASLTSPLLISGHVASAFERYSWPGNVRELQDTIRELLVWVDPGETIIGLKHLAKIRFGENRTQRAKKKADEVLEPSTSSLVFPGQLAVSSVDAPTCEAELIERLTHLIFSSLTQFDVEDLPGKLEQVFCVEYLRRFPMKNNTQLAKFLGIAVRSLRTKRQKQKQLQQ